MVTYPFGDAAKSLERDFPQLCFRLKQLEDRLVSYLLCGAPDCLVSCAFERNKTAYFSAVAFEEAPARKYEAFMERYFSKRKNTLSAELPRPPFSVEIEVQFGGGDGEKFLFSFGEYSDALVLAFCEEVEVRGAYLGRHRFSKQI